MWEILGDLLLSDGRGSNLESFQDEFPFDPEGCCRTMFQLWIQGNGVKPCSWRKLIEVIQDCGQEALTEEIRTALLLQNEQGASKYYWYAFSPSLHDHYCAILLAGLLL